MPFRFSALLLFGGCFVAMTATTQSAPTAGVRHWAFQPVRRPAVPSVHNSPWVHTPVDAFILARLEREGLQPAPTADRRTLVRRVFLDLIGLPPTPEEVDRAVGDKSGAWFEKVVDDLLSRPQYGERWGRHWLDVARYAETNGYERDGAKPNAWRYRDYVIDSFNKDKPYDRFLTEQLAGDEIEGSNAETQIATTFLRLGTWDDEPADPIVDRYDQLDDVLGTTAAAFMGVTLRCARCHDHKFEPFSQVDYYRLLAVFQPLTRPQVGCKELDLPVGDEAPHRRQRAVAGGQLAAAASATAGRGMSAAAIPYYVFSSQYAALSTEFSSPANARPIRAYVWYETGPKPTDSYVLKRGDPTHKGDKVDPGLPAVLVKEPPAPPRATAKTSGRRLWLARWLTSPEHPLTTRVIVNRVWQHHFGRGLVGTPNDFGVMGERPTHPELLDWLASEFVANGWRLKPLHRMIVLSNAYQMSATRNPESTRLDPDGLFLSRWRQPRLEAEAVRDSMLAVSGQLNNDAGGPSIYPKLPRSVLEGQSRPGEGWGSSNERQQARRSVYIYVKRVLAVPELDLLDAPNNAESCEARPVSTTAPQALTFLNGEFAHLQARHFAERLRREVGDDVNKQIERAFLLALGRPPRSEETAAALSFLAEQQRLIVNEKLDNARQRALEAFCLVVLNTNEFVYLN